MTLVPHTTGVSAAVGQHVHRITELTRQLTELVRKQQSRM